MTEKMKKLCLIRDCTGFPREGTEFCKKCLAEIDARRIQVRATAMRRIGQQVGGDHNHVVAREPHRIKFRPKLC